MITKNIIVSGEYKTGKTKMVIMPMVDEIIKGKAVNEEGESIKRSLLFVDKNYEYYGKYADVLKEAGYEIKVFNFDDPKKSDSVNILELPYFYYKNGEKDKAYELVDSIVKPLFPTVGNVDPFWNDAATALVRGCILELFALAKPEEINFLSVSKFLELLDDNNINSLQEYLLKNGDKVAYRDLVSVLAAPVETRLSILSVARVEINKLANSIEQLNVIINGDTKLSDFLTMTEGSLIKEKRAIFLIPKLEDYGQNKLASMLLTEIYEGAKDQNWNFFLDNFDWLSDMNNFTGMLLASTYRNIYMILGVRDLDKLTSIYGKEILRACEVKNTKDLVAKLGEFENDFVNKQKLQLPSLKETEIKTFNLLEKMSEVKEK